MMITAGGDEGRLRAEPLLQFKSQHAAIKFQCALEVGHFQVHMTDGDARINRPRGGIIFHEFFLPLSR